MTSADDLRSDSCAIPSLSIVTPSFRGDLDLCRRLVTSVKRFAPSHVEHRIIVPSADLPLFRSLGDDRVHIVVAEDILPWWLFTRISRKYSVNLRHPWPPVRGWIRQQLLKISMCNALSHSVALAVDSDVEFIRPFASDLFWKHGAVRLYREQDAISDSLPRHVIWHKKAREILGLPGQLPPFDGYISPMVAVDPHIVRSMCRRVEEVSGREWESVLAKQFHFSEYTLYGVYASTLDTYKEASRVSANSLCHEYWEERPMSLQEAKRFVRSAGAEDVAVCISAKSRTPLHVRAESIG